MKTFKRLALMGLLVCGLMAATAGAASATTVLPAGATATFTTGQTSFTPSNFASGAAAITCQSATVTATVPASPGNTGPGFVQTQDVSLAFNNCTDSVLGGAATVTQNPGCVSLGLANGTPDQSRIVLTSTASTACFTISAVGGGCTLQVPELNSQATFGNTWNDGPPATDTITPQSLSFTRSGFCGFVTPVSPATWGSGAPGSAGNVVFTQASGPAITVNP